MSDQEKPKPIITNVVSSVNLKTNLNLNQIASKIEKAEYNQNFKRIKIEIDDPKATAFIYSAGKIICLGTKSLEDSRKAARQISKMIVSLGYKVEFKDFKIVNIVASCNVNFPISLTKLMNHLVFKPTTNFVDFRYEPEIFPAFIMHMKNPKVTISIFASGKINFTGAKERETINLAFNEIYPLVLKFKNESTLENK